MRKKKHNVLYIFLPAIAITCASCTIEKPIESLFNPAPTRRPTVAETDMSGRFQDSGANNPSAIESAMELSGKYAQLLEESTALKADNQRLTGENQRLTDQIPACRNSLTQTQNELAEANDLLIEMRIELNNWKTNILGFRDEMRNAENAQLDALVKILEVLGGQAQAGSPPDLAAPSANTSSQGPNPPKSPMQNEKTSGKING